MKRIVAALLVLLVCLAAANAHAGRIFGDIKMDGRPVQAGLMVTIAPAAPASAPGDTAKHSAAPADTTLTDKYGSYRLNVKKEGKCVLALVYEKKTLTLEVFSYKNATRYDLILEKKDGKLSLRRK
jgi:hypothetical protein